MRPIDQDVRDDILKSEGNIIITASAGTGKTYTTIKHIISSCQSNINHQTFAAVTFTRKATKEIISRLGSNEKKGFIGTNDNFILVEVIQPFMHDVYGSEFRIAIKPDFSSENEIFDFDDGIRKIRTSSLLCKYSEVTSNFGFQLALDILKKSHSARRYLKSKYYRIYVDEYQDSDSDMHDFFMYISDYLKIPLFIVGDSKQLIYGFRTNYSDGFDKVLQKDNFNKFELIHNFRSNQVIQNFSNLFMDSVRKNYRKTEFNNEVIMLNYSNEIEAAEFIQEWIDDGSDCAFLHFSNDNAKRWSEVLTSQGINFSYIPSSPLDDARVESEHIWIARGIASYLLQKRYTEYDFIDEIFNAEGYSVSKIKNKLLKILQCEILSAFENQCLSLYSYFGYEVNNKIKKEIEILYNVVNNSDYVSTYNQKQYKMISGTIHSSKGLEFKQVIINAGDFNFNSRGIDFLHYVAISRPEKKLLILSGSNFHRKRYIGYIDGVIGQLDDPTINIDINDVISIITK